MQMTTTLPRPVIALLIALSLIVQAGCTNKGMNGAENGAAWADKNLAVPSFRGCSGAGTATGHCIAVALALAPVFVSVGAVVGGASAELEKAQAVAYPCGRHNPNCEGLVGDTDHPDYVPLSDSLAPDPNQAAERLATQVLTQNVQGMTFFGAQL